jgi:hypothetical protein
VNAHADAERSVPGAVAGHDARREPDRLVGIVDTQEHGVADRLNFFGAVLVEQPSDGGAELGGRVGGVLVAVCFGQRGVAGQVGEQEGLVSRGCRSTPHPGLHDRGDEDPEHERPPHFPCQQYSEGEPPRPALGVLAGRGASHLLRTTPYEWVWE